MRTRRPCLGGELLSSLHLLWHGSKLWRTPECSAWSRHSSEGWMDRWFLIARLFRWLRALSTVYIESSPFVESSRNIQVKPCALVFARSPCVSGALLVHVQCRHLSTTTCSGSLLVCRTDFVRLAFLATRELTAMIFTTISATNSQG